MVKKKKATKKKATKKKVATKKKATKKKATKKKATKKKATKKKVATKKKATKKKATKKKATKKKAVKAVKAVVATESITKLAQKVKKARTKSDTLSLLAHSSGLTKKEVTLVLENMAKLISHDVGKGGPGVFALPGLVKIVRAHKPATKARKGINPFTKEPMMFKAKPARNIVRVRPLKALKDQVK
mgnify:CR=1 FL=1